METPADVRLGSLVPYLFCQDAEAALDWYVRVFGFTERSRWPGLMDRL